MRKTLFATLLSAQLFVCWLGDVSGQPPPCGSVLATYRGVTTQSNGQDQFTDNSCLGRGIYGLQFQCVEYVKRFYSQALSVDTSQWSGDAIDYFATASDKGLIAFSNGGGVAPAADDILVFDSSGTLGHVAIVTSVTADAVTFIEQNWSYTGVASLTLNYQNGTYTIADRITGKGRKFHVLGWLRVPPKEIVLQPGPVDGKDIWVTSVYSYATCSGSYPGGGLYDSELRVGGWGDLYYALLQFDLGGLPAHASSVSLQMYCFSDNGGTVTPMYIDRITQFWWDWQTTGTGCDHERLWWADRPNTVQWTAVTLPAPIVGQWYTVDITDLYNAWQSGQYPNYGLQLRPVSNDNNFDFFYSSRYMDDSTLRPKLVIRQ